MDDGRIDTSPDRAVDGGTDSTEAFLTWARARAIPLATTAPGSGLDDLLPLAPLFEGARVVGLGEHSHTVRESFRCKHRLIELLSGALGCSAVVIEEGVACVQPLDRYVTSGVGDVRALVGALGHRDLWATEEMVDLLEWIGAFNRARAPEEQVRLFGMDINAPRAGLDQAVAFFDVHHVRLADVLRRDEVGLGWLSRGDWLRSLEAYRRLDEGQREDGARIVGEVLAAVEGWSSPPDVRMEWEWAHRHLVVLDRAVAMFRAMVADDWPRAIMLRDEAMAAQLLWILETISPRGRVVVSSHNGHMAKTVRTVPDERLGGGIVPMGHLLAKDLGASYVAVGVSMGSVTDRTIEGTERAPTAPVGSIDHTLSRVGLPRFALELRRAPGGAVGEWLDGPRPLRYMTTFEVMRSRAAFDALVYLDKGTPTRRMSRPGEGAR